MNIKDFLIDNYIWIIVIILITIVTIIGFLADKKKESKNKNDGNQQPMASPNNMQANNLGPMQYQQGQMNPMPQQVNNMAMNNGDIQNVQPMQMNQSMMNAEPMINNNQNMINMNNADQPLLNPMEQGTMDNMNNSTMIEVPSQLEQSYQPLSEQKPNIPPQPVPDFNNMNNNPQPISSVDNNYSQNMNVQNQIPTSNMMQPISVDMNNQNNNYNGMVQNNNQINSTMSMGVPTNMVPIPQPVNPQPIIANNQPLPVEPMNQNMDYNNNFAQQPAMMNSTIPIGVPTPVMNPTMQAEPMIQNPMNQNMDYTNNMSQPQVDMNNQNNNGMNSSPLPAQNPVNFVFGPQNNNSNM